MDSGEAERQAAGRVLVITGHQPLGDLISRSLTINGYGVEVAEDANRGIVLFHVGKFDLLVVDENTDSLPASIKATSPQMPVILMGSPNTDDGLPPGVDYLVTVPFTMADLQHAVRQVLGGVAG